MTLATVRTFCGSPKRSADRATTAGGASSALVLTEALDALTDAAARASLSSQPGFGLLPASRGRRRLASPSLNAGQRHWPA